MSKFGLNIGDKTVYEVKTPDQALELISTVVGQYFGEYWTQHKPRCPLCNAGLEDTEKHMNRPVGECSSEKCGSTIHIADFMGKIKDIMGEWDINKHTWLQKVRDDMQKTAHVTSHHYRTSGVVRHSTPISPTVSATSSVQFVDDIDKVDANTVFVW